MRRLLMFLPVIFLLFSCNKVETGKESEKPKTTDAGTETKKPQSGNDSKTSDIKISTIEQLSYDITTVAAGLKYEGRIVGGAKWRDRNGDNVLIITETDISEDKAKRNEPDMRHKELYAYQYVIDDRENKLLWKINDFIKDCPVDITLNYVNNSLTITDLDNNGIAESTFLYVMACRGDVSPLDMKLMMHEDDRKYAIRGSQKLKLEGETYGGEINVDKSFNDAPEAFLKYAKEQWNKNRDQKLGD